MFDSLPTSPLQNRWRQQAQPMPVVVSIIQRKIIEEETGLPEKTYLLIRRKNEPYSNRWALVGGKWDFGETLVTAANREVKEETGLDTTFVALQGLVSERMAPMGEQDGAAHFLIFVCQLEAVSGVAREQDEGAVAWFKVGEIEDLQAVGTIIPSDYVMLQRFIGADPLTHHEAEMVIGGSDDPSGEMAQLIRFEQIK